MWPDRGSNPGPLTYESGVLPTALCSPRQNEVENAKVVYNTIQDAVAKKMTAEYAGVNSLSAEDADVKKTKKKKKQTAEYTEVNNFTD